jgi:putative ABC transport system permease protein
MGIAEQLRVALRALSVNKLRSSLTMLGIIIGVGAVITLLSVGQGVQKLVTGQLQSIGTNLLFVVPGNMNDSQTQPRSSGMQQMTLSDVNAISDPLNVPDVIAVAPELMSSADIAYGKK